MLRLPDSSLLRYGGAIVSVALVTLLAALLDSLLETAQPFTVYLLAVMFVAWYGRLLPSLLALGCGAVAAQYFFVPPRGSLFVDWPAGYRELIVYIVTGTAIVMIGARVRRAARKAEENSASPSAAEKRPGESEERYKALYEDNPAMYFTVNADGVVLSVNRFGAEQLGYTVEELVGRRVTDVFYEEDREAARDLLAACVRNPSQIAHWEFRKVHKDGSLLWVKEAARAVREADGNTVILIVCEDITERKRTEEEKTKLLSEVESTRHRVNSIVATVPGVVWEAWGEPDEATQRINFVSDYVETMMGYSVEEWLETPNFWLTIVHPDDKKRAAEKAASFFASGKGGVDQFRWVARDGSVKWVEAQSVVISDEAGLPLGMRGVTMDITERKRAEERQRFLSEASNVLASSLDYEVTLQNLVRLATPALADWCAVHMLEENGRVRRLAVAHSDPALAAWTERFERCHPGEADGPDCALTVMKTGRPEFYHDIPSLVRGAEEQRSGGAGGFVQTEGRGSLKTISSATAVKDEGNCEGVSSSFIPHPSSFTKAPAFKKASELGMKSAMIVPLLARGHGLGAITFISGETNYTEADLALAEDLARRATLAVDNARLYRKAQEAIGAREEALRLRDELLIREQAARAEAEAANRAKDEFLATVSHELRTPLNAMLGWASLLRRGNVDKETSDRALETIERNARAQAQIIEDILDVSRIITGRLRLDVRPVDLTSIVEAVIESGRPATEAKGIELKAALDQAAGLVSGDPDRLQQVVWNLLTNAVKFTPKGGQVLVQLERGNSQQERNPSERNQERNQERNLYVELTVKDTGQGIDPEFLPYVFDRFRQADSTPRRKHGGLGLGLSIVRHLVEMHGGTVHASSPGEGKGATFIVKLPLMGAHKELRAGVDRPVSAADKDPFDGAPLLDGLRVLVVDDDSDTRQMLALTLSERRAEVKTCSRATEAIEALREWKPDVLVSDIQMPGEDGYDLMRRVRELGPELKGDIPAVALTAYARVEDRMKAFSVGYNIHVAKPVEPVELIMVIAGLAGRGQGSVSVSSPKSKVGV